MTIEESFAKALGRAPTDAQRERLHRLREALDLRDNDALWTVVIALEHYDALYREYPARLGEETARAIEGARAAFAAAAAVEAAKAQATLAQQVARTSAKLAQRLVARPLRVEWLAAACAVWVLFGALCMAAGARLGSGASPLGARTTMVPATGVDLLRAVLGLPAGWMALVFLLPGAFIGARSGWQLAGRGEGAFRDQVLGWALVAGSVLGAAGCVVLLFEVLR
jgi:hypothetical protein